jgi:hypothetical protein
VERRDWRQSEPVTGLIEATGTNSWMDAGWGLQEDADHTLWIARAAVDHAPVHAALLPLRTRNPRLPTQPPDLGSPGEAWDLRAPPAATFQCHVRPPRQPDSQATRTALSPPLIWDSSFEPRGAEAHAVVEDGDEI